MLGDFQNYEFRTNLLGCRLRRSLDDRRFCRVRAMEDSEAKNTTPCLSIHYLGLARLISGTEKEPVPCPKEGTLKQALDLLCERYGREFQTTVFTMNGTLQNYVKIELDEIDINELQGLKTVLSASAKLKFIVTIPSLAGG